MRRFDFRCPSCGRVECDVVLVGDQSPRRDVPSCPCAGAVPMEWIPQMRMAIIADSARQPIQIEQPDGSIREVAISSLADIRRMERESEQAWRNGDPGAQPLRWRAYSQDDSNQDVNCFGDTPAVRPDPEFVKRAAPRAATAEEIAQQGTYGPGVSDANASSLAEV